MVVGKSYKKLDSEAILTGRPIYTDDLINQKNVLSIKILRSPYAFAKIKDINVEKAKSLDGVVDIYTYKDVEQIRYSEGGEAAPEMSPHDRVLLEPIVRFVGDEVAIVVAEDERIAEKARKLIKVDYEVFEPILDMEKALDNEIIIHEGKRYHGKPFTKYDNNRNLVSDFSLSEGDVDKEFKECDVILEREYRTQAQQHCSMETNRSYAYIDNKGKITIISGNQTISHMRRQTAQAIGVPLKNVRLKAAKVGGAFGGKKLAITEPYVAFVTNKTKRPSKLILDREEMFMATSVRHPIITRIKIGADKNGNIKAIDMKVLSNTGAYGSNAAAVTMESGQNVLPMYARVPAIRFNGKSVYTNMVPSGPLRGYGTTQGTFAMASIMNELARELKMDPVELLLKNTIRKGDEGGILPHKMRSFNVEECINRGKDLIEWDKKFPRVKVGENKVRGVGAALALHTSGIAGQDTATVILRLEEDGSYMLMVGSSDLGTGAETVLCQIAAESLNTDMDSISICTGDTNTAPYETGAYASCTTYITGNAVVRAGEKLKEKLLEIASKKMCLAKSDLLLEKDRIKHKKDETMYVLLTEIVRESLIGENTDQIMVKASYGSREKPRPFMAGFAEVEVDTLTGKVDLIKFVLVADCGTIINPNLAKVQAEGGLMQGIGLALYEDVIYNKRGNLLTNNFMHYNIPIKSDVGEVIVEFRSDYEPTGPYGAKSIGEAVVHTPSPAIANAICNAVGFQGRELPITPEKVFMGMREIKKY